MVDIEAIGVADPRFDAWHGVIRTAYAEGREPGWWESLEATRLYFARAGGRSRHLALVATEGASVVGGVELSLPLDADLETFSVELGVATGARGRGVGAALWTAVLDAVRGDDRTVAQGEVLVPEGRAEDWPGVRFAEARGLRCASTEHRFVLDLPVPAAVLDAVEVGSDVVSWVGPCPDEFIDEWARMRTHMNEDVPMGDLTVTARRIDADRVRDSDRVMAEQGWTKLRSMAVGPDGTGRGYTELFVSAHDASVAVQDDTFVDRAHRGEGLGLRLKVANLRLLQETEGLLGDRRWVQTYCEVDNAAMRRTNARLGFRQVDELREYEGRV